MKTDKILVGINGAVMSLASGKKAKAVYPASKDQKTTYMLLTDGKLASMNGMRINGVGVARYFAEHGFEPAGPDNADAAELADMVDRREGTALVEKHNMEYATQLSHAFAGQRCTFVPFDAAKPTVPATVGAPRGITSVAFDLSGGFASGVVQTEYLAGELGSGFGVQLSDGWLVGPEGSPESMPRNTEYGGGVERAVFVICNSGIGSLAGARNLEMDIDAPLDEPYPRGKLVVQLKNGDWLTVGINAVDELCVRYSRGDQVLYSRESAIGSQEGALRLGPIIGSIAAALVRVQELDATPVKAPRARVKSFF